MDFPSTTVEPQKLQWVEVRSSWVDAREERGTPSASGPVSNRAGQRNQTSVRLARTLGFVPGPTSERTGFHRDGAGAAGSTGALRCDSWQYLAIPRTANRG